MQFSYTRILVAILLYFFAYHSLVAEVILLKNGQSMEGRIIRQTRGQIEIKTATGQIILQKKDILRIQFKSLPEKQKILPADQNSNQSIEDRNEPNPIKEQNQSKINIKPFDNQPVMNNAYFGIWAVLLANAVNKRMIAAVKQ